MASQDVLSDYPERVPTGSPQRPDHYVRRRGYYALHSPERTPADRRELFALRGGAIAVFEGEPPAERRDADEVSAVYSLGESGPLAVPTGLVHVRLAEELRLEDLADDWRQRGFAIDRSPGFAPHSGWLRAMSGGIPAALAGVARLSELSRVEHIEPQMLIPSARR